MSLKNDAPSLIKPGDIIKVEDLEKAYYKVPVSKAAQAYQCFRGPDGKLYAITFLPFGHRLATWIITKIYQPIKAFFGVLKLPCFNYIDDWFWSILRALMPRFAPLIDRVFKFLGWTFAARKAQLGTSVQVLGFTVDVERRMFFVPDVKVQRALNQIYNLQEQARRHRACSPHQALRLAGTVASMILACPHVHLFSRSINLHAVLNDMIPLNIEACDELSQLVQLLHFQNGRPFIDERYESELWVDSGEVERGAHLGGHDLVGLLPLEVIGRSSALRELTGLALALKEPNMPFILSGRRIVRVNMDARAAIANLVNDGGPVENLCQAAKAVHAQTRTLGIELDVQRNARETLGICHVDALSKAHTIWSLRPSVATNLLHTHGTHPFLADFASIGTTVRAIIARNITNILVVPQRTSASWWPLVTENATALHPLGMAPSVITSSSWHPVLPPWPMYAAVFM